MLPMRRKIATLLGTVMVAGVMSVSMPAATAQVGYPPGPCTPGNVVVDYGTRVIGETFNIRMVTKCLWNPGDTINLTVNGQPAGAKVVDGGSGITVNVTVSSATELSINDPVVVRGGCGENSAVGVSPSAAAGGVTESYTARFRVNCAAAPTKASSVPGGIAFTGANILKWGGIALVLMVAGWFLVGVTRRRRTDPTA